MPTPELDRVLNLITDHVIRNITDTEIKELDGTAWGQDSGVFIIKGGQNPNKSMLDILNYFFKGRRIM